LTAAGIAGVASRDEGAASGVVNVARQLGGWRLRPGRPAPETTAARLNCPPGQTSPSPTAPTSSAPDGPAVVAHTCGNVSALCSTRNGLTAGSARVTWRNCRFRTLHPRDR
jgi:hypothetical protein